MENQQPSHVKTPSPVTKSMIQALDRYITPKLAEHGWLSTDEENQDLVCEIIRNLLDLCHRGNSERFILQTLADDETHLAMAKWISTIFLGRNPGHKDDGLLSFTDDIVNFFHDLCHDHLARRCIADVGSQVVADGDLSSSAQNLPQIASFPFFTLPAELRNMVYREILVIPGLVRTFTPPALLHANKVLRNEALGIFYGENHFEITIKRSPQDELRGAAGSLPSVDMWVWRRFLHMWDDFNCFGSNCLRHVKHLTLIYELSMNDPCSFGEGEFDERLGFRFSSDPFDVERTGNFVEDSGRDLPSDDAENEAEAEDGEAESAEGESSEQDSSGDVDDNEAEQAAEDSDPVAVFELSRGTLNLRSRRETQLFLFHKMCEYGTDEMWDVYPMKRLTHMLWRGVRDCPLASNNVDMICEDLPYWMDTIGSHTRDEPVEFDEVDDEDDW